MKVKLALFIFIYTFILIMNVYGSSLNVYSAGNNYICIDNQKKILFESESASKTIQFAIDLSLSREGGEVILNAGVFELDSPVRLKNQVWLRGKRAGTILELAKNNNTCIEIFDADSVKITELTISSASNAGSFAGISGKNTINCLIEDVSVTGFAAYGFIFEQKNDNLKVNRCYFINNFKAHVCFEDISEMELTPIHVLNCNFFGGGYGIISREENSKSSGLNISDNIFSYLKGMAIDTGINSLKISGNKLYWIGLDGMRIKGNNFVMTGNINSWIRGHGLVLDGARKGIIDGNNFNDLGVRSIDGLRKCGIAMYNSSQINIQGNSLWNFGDQGYLEYAVYEDSECKNNTLLANAGWFHYHSDAFGLFGKETKRRGNTSKHGEYRGDYWDFTQKYSQSIEKYLGSLPNVQQSNLNPKPVTLEIKPIENVVIECKDHFNQVLTLNGNSAEKNGWVKSKLQLWELRKSGDYYVISNKSSNKVLQSDKEDLGNFKVTMGNLSHEDHQLWELKNAGNGYVVIVNKLNGKLLDSQGNFSFDWEKNNVSYRGQKIFLSDYSHQTTQAWRLREPFPAYTYEK